MPDWETYKSEREADALALVLAANAMSDAFEKSNAADFDTSIKQNLALWIAIKTFCERPDSVFPIAVRRNLVKLADYVTTTCLKMENGEGAAALDTLININMQISEGLLSALKETEHNLKEGERGIAV